MRVVAFTFAFSAASAVALPSPPPSPNPFALNVGPGRRDVSPNNPFLAPTGSPLAKRSSGSSCNHDVCLRSVTGHSSQAAQDCVSYVSVATVTVTSTVDLARATSVVKEKRHRQCKKKHHHPALTTTAHHAPPTGLPAYADGCDDESQFASACACIGAAASTSSVTLTVTKGSSISTPTSISASLSGLPTAVPTTLTPSSVSSVSSSAAAPTRTPTFVMKATSGSASGTYLNAEDKSSYYQPYFTASRESASSFTFSQNSVLHSVNPSFDAYYSTSVADISIVLLTTADFAGQFGGVPFKCTLSGATDVGSTGSVSCVDSSTGFQYLSECMDATQQITLSIGNTLDFTSSDGSCDAVTLGYEVVG